MTDMLSLYKSRSQMSEVENATPKAMVGGGGTGGADFLKKMQLQAKEEKPFSQIFKMPKAVNFVLLFVNCTIFSYNGLRVILFIFALNYLVINTNQATVFYHLLSFICFLSPLLGAYIADSGLYKFWTVIVFSGISIVGYVLLTIASLLKPSFPLALTAIMLIGIGTGCIKPCIVALGEKHLPADDLGFFNRCFPVFYFLANIASISMLITPIIIGAVTCNNQDCFVIAFAVLLVVFVLSLIIFGIGKRMYPEEKSEDNITAEFFRCCIVMIKGRVTDKADRKKKLYEYAADDYFEEFVMAIVQIKRIAVLFIPVPLFFALFQQMGSRWIIQGTELDGNLFGKMIIQPYQMIGVNLILIIIFVPLCDEFIYKLFNQNRTEGLKRRMAVGFFVAAATFSMAFLLQKCIERERTTPIPENYVQIRFNPLNQCRTILKLTQNTSNDSYVLDLQKYHKKLYFFKVEANLSDTFHYEIAQYSCNSLKNSTILSRRGSFSVKGGSANTVFTWYTTSYSNLFVIPVPTNSTILNKSFLRIILMRKQRRRYQNLRVQLDATSFMTSGMIFELKTPPKGLYTSIIYANETSRVDRGFFKVNVLYDETKTNVTTIDGNSTLNILKNGVGTLVIFESKRWHMFYVSDRRGSSISLFWQLPQFITMAVAELLFIISAYTFVCMETPPGTEAIVSAILFLTVALGDLLIIIFTGYTSVLSTEFLCFTVIGAVGAIIFCILAYFYKSINILSKTDQSKTKPLRQLTEKFTFLEE